MECLIIHPYTLDGVRIIILKSTLEGVRVFNLPSALLGIIILPSYLVGVRYYPPIYSRWCALLSSHLL
jgi:hypothetical protein